MLVCWQESKGLCRKNTHARLTASNYLELLVMQHIIQPILTSSYRVFAAVLLRFLVKQSP